MRATAELYEKLAPTLLIFNKEFRDADERDARGKREESAAVVVPSSGSLFIESVEQSSAVLASSLEAMNGEPVEAVSQKHHATILEKLVQSGEPEDEIPPGV